MNQHRSLIRPIWAARAAQECTSWCASRPRKECYDHAPHSWASNRVAETVSRRPRSPKPRKTKHRRRAKQIFSTQLQPGIRPVACELGPDSLTRQVSSRSGVFPLLLFICSKGGAWNRPLVPHFLGCFPSLSWILHVVGAGVKTTSRTADPGTSNGAQPDPAAPSIAVRWKRASPTLQPELWKGKRKEAGPSRSPLTPRTRTEADDSFPLWIIKPTRPRKPMRDGRQCSGTGSEDFQGSVIVKWKVLLSPRSRKKTSRCPRKQVSRAEPRPGSIIRVRFMISAIRNKALTVGTAHAGCAPFHVQRSFFIHPSVHHAVRRHGHLIPARSGVTLTIY